MDTSNIAHLLIQAVLESIDDENIRLIFCPKEFIYTLPKDKVNRWHIGNRCDNTQEGVARTLAYVAQSLILTLNEKQQTYPSAYIHIQNSQDDVINEMRVIRFCIFMCNHRDVPIDDKDPIHFYIDTMQDQLVKMFEKFNVKVTAKKPNMRITFHTISKKNDELVDLWNPFINIKKTIEGINFEDNPYFKGLVDRRIRGLCELLKTNEVYLKYTLNFPTEKSILVAKEFGIQGFEKVRAPGYGTLDIEVSCEATPEMYRSEWFRQGDQEYRKDVMQSPKTEVP